MTTYAAVGDDGTLPVVWGLGVTAEAALEDARAELTAAECASELAVHEITEAQALAILAGDVSWPVTRTST